MILENSDQKDENGYIRPSLYFELCFGLQGLGNEWLMPGGKSLSDTERDLWESTLLMPNFSPNTILTATLEQQRPDIAMHFMIAQEFLKAIIDLNPELEKLDYDPTLWADLRGTLHGLVSGLNIDDIQFYINGGTKTEALDSLRNRVYLECLKDPDESWYPQELREVFNRFAYTMGAGVISNIRWVPSPQTIDKINAQLDVKDAEIAERPRPPAL